MLLQHAEYIPPEDIVPPLLISVAAVSILAFVILYLTKLKKRSEKKNRFVEKHKAILQLLYIALCISIVIMFYYLFTFVAQYILFYRIGRTIDW
jgi:hypothetical protein